MTYIGHNKKCEQHASVSRSCRLNVEKDFDWMKDVGKCDSTDRRPHPQTSDNENEGAGENMGH